MATMKLSTALPINPESSAPLKENNPYRSSAIESRMPASSQPSRELPPPGCLGFWIGFAISFIHGLTYVRSPREPAVVLDGVECGSGALAAFFFMFIGAPVMGVLTAILVQAIFMVVKQLR